jgi:hypothetical protein
MNFYAERPCFIYCDQNGYTTFQDFLSSTQAAKMVRESLRWILPFSVTLSASGLRTS